MLIELLYFEGCPNHEVAHATLAEALQVLGLPVSIRQVAVVDNVDAVTKRFLGSPSVRINGRDVEGAPETEEHYAMKCRRYRSGNTITGYPSRELVLSALREALGTSEARP